MLLAVAAAIFYSQSARQYRRAPTSQVAAPPAAIVPAPTVAPEPDVRPAAPGNTDVAVARESTTQDITPARPAPASPATPAEKVEKTDSIKNVSGSWTLATRVESSSYAAFQGLRLGYEIELEQAGDRVKGAGRKITQNGDEIGSRAQTPISVAGTIDGDRLTLRFNERGTRRATEGKFVLLMDESGTLRGRFSSTAARSSGTVEAHRVGR